MRRGAWEGTPQRWCSPAKIIPRYLCQSRWQDSHGHEQILRTLELSSLFLYLLFQTFRCIRYVQNCSYQFSSKPLEALVYLRIGKKSRTRITRKKKRLRTVWNGRDGTAQTKAKTSHKFPNLCDVTRFLGPQYFRTANCNCNNLNWIVKTWDVIVVTQSHAWAQPHTVVWLVGLFCD